MREREKSERDGKEKTMRESERERYGKGKRM
jgi:hypothetical protein